VSAASTIIVTQCLIKSASFFTFYTALYVQQLQTPVELQHM